MRYTIYLDMVFWVDTCMDLLLLWFAGYACRREVVWWRYLLGALTGGLGMVLSIWIPFPWAWLAGVFHYGVVGLGMCLLTFSPKNIREACRCYGALLLISFVFGGSLNWLYHSSLIKHAIENGSFIKESQIGALFTFALLSGGIVLVLLTGFSRYRRENWGYYKVTLHFDNDHSIEGVGYVDTGNFLQDPMTGRPVAVAEARWIYSLLPAGYRKLLTDYIKENRIPYEQITGDQFLRIRMIPYCTVEEKWGEMLGIQCQSLELRGNDHSMVSRCVVIAVSRTPVAVGGRYQILLHRDMIKEDVICCR